MNKETLREKMSEIVFNVMDDGFSSKDSDDIADEIMSLIFQSESKEQLEVFNCPNCPNQGWYSDGYQVNGEWEQEQVQVQCEFCCTHPQSVFNYMAKVKVSNFDLKIKE